MQEQFLEKFTSQEAVTDYTDSAHIFNLPIPKKLQTTLFCHTLLSDLGASEPPVWHTFSVTVIKQENLRGIRTGHASQNASSWFCRTFTWRLLHLVVTMQSQCTHEVNRKLYLLVRGDLENLFPVVEQIELTQ
jgi:hypothetical protein